MGLAHTVGAGVRAVGRSARDLDPAHRRDGAGLAFLGLAIVTAAVTWFRPGNPVTHGLSAAVRGGFGLAGPAVPVLLALLAWRYLRHPDRNSDNARVIIGWVALIIGALGLVHIAHGTPRPADGAASIRAAGGIIGYVASAPLVALVTPWVAVPLLALVTGFGLLVISGTPLHQVPGRLAELFGLRHPVDEDEEAADADARKAGRTSARQLTGGRKKQAAIEAGEHERPYDSPLLGGTLPRGGAAGRKAGAAAPAADASAGDAALSEALAFGQPSAASQATPAGAQTGRDAPWHDPWTESGDGSSKDGPAAAASAAEHEPAEPKKTEQLTLYGASDASYTLPPPPCCGQGPRPRRGRAPTTSWSRP